MRTQSGCPFAHLFARQSLGVFAGMLFLAALAYAAPDDPPGAPNEYVAMLRKSSYAFRGTVKKLNDSNVKLVAPGERTVIVHVDEVLHGAQTVGDFTGDDVTVVLDKPGTVKEKDQLIFFANPKVIGKNVALGEVGHLAPSPTPAAVAEAAQPRNQVVAAASALKDEDLRKHIAGADLVVTGTVTATSPVRRDEDPTRPSEHDPEWWQATIKVQAVEKGDAKPGDSLTVYYPHSTDVRWFRVPKLDKVKDGVFFLHVKRPDAQGAERELRIEGYTILHPNDVEGFDQRDRVREQAKAVR
jgi:hypothetical protein